MKKKWGYDDVMNYAKKERDSVPSVPWIKFNQEFLDAEVQHLMHNCKNYSVSMAGVKLY